MATIKGGAVYYDYARPTFGSTIIYTNNSAQYGRDIASYAVKLTYADDPMKSLKIDNFGSGIAYETVLSFALRDYDNQIMVLDNENQIIITSVNSSVAQVSGFNSGRMTSTLFLNLIIK